MFGFSVHQAFFFLSGRAAFAILCSEFKLTLLDEVFAPFIICLLQINCLLQGCVHFLHILTLIATYISLEDEKAVSYCCHANNDVDVKLWC